MSLAEDVRPLAPGAGADARAIVVLKFGSSVLSDRARAPEVVSEIYRAVRAGRRVVAVTSAFAGVTDRLLGEAAALGCAHDNVNAPAYVALGEETSAALLALACDRAGLAAIALKTPELGLIAHGPADDAAPAALRPDALARALAAHDVVVVPGFVGVDAKGRTVLLGRGGSDLTAVFLANALGAERVRLVKDVDGVYDADPNAHAAARRFARLSWREARAVAGKLVQPRALDFAAAQGVTIEVGALGARDATIIGAEAAPAAPLARRRKLRVALAGCGVVGAGVAARLLAHADAFEISAILVRDLARARDVAAPPALFTDDAQALLQSGADIVVDALSCGQAGARLSEAALARGVHVVSANKQALVAAYPALQRAAAAGGARLAYSASVGGGAPLLETVAQALGAGARISAIEGVLNGTVNFVLERLAAGQDVHAALAAARAAGLAEEDPSADLNGADAAAKLTLIAIAAFGRAPDALDVAALDAARASETPLRQVCRLRRAGAGLVGAVGYAPAAQSPFPDLRGDRNAIIVRAEDGRAWRGRGRGAGRWPTTESVFADLTDLSAAFGG